ncbi:hypothetical protein FRB93_001085 [Tulasnella sp. JGI-2019a]|nr:hypothetical protein FRB93_001085 [Tulasnella sp. JGI-2019a]
MAWATSKRQGIEGIQTYKLENGGIQEARKTGRKDDIIIWEIGHFFHVPIGVSNTAPLAAINSFAVSVPEPSARGQRNKVILQLHVLLSLLPN